MTHEIVVSDRYETFNLKAGACVHIAFVDSLHSHELGVITPLQTEHPTLNHTPHQPVQEFT